MAKQLENRGDIHLVIGFFVRLGVTHVVCVSETLPLQFPELVEHLRLSVADAPTARIADSFPAAFAYIDRRMALNDAAALLRGVRPQMQPNSGFWTLAADEDDYDGALGDCDLILSREDFAMLHALHRFVPLPALSSNILRVICDDDLQVPVDENSDDEDADAHRIPSTLRGQPVVTLDVGTGHLPRRSARVIAPVPKHSPLTRRLSKHKPLVEINLATLSPQFQQKPAPQPLQPDRAVRGGRSNNSDDNSHDDDREARTE
ncbi:hypothetical protein PybrP1_011024 [[Pythium] brassicae (nom. inval.)]|nr:hypothetical protein PybrP1_011024 [[Pythium] brassicae (nom. inval.)]